MLAIQTNYVHTNPKSKLHQKHPQKLKHKIFMFEIPGDTE